MKKTIQLTIALTAMLFLNGCDSMSDAGGVDEAALDPAAYQYKGAADPLLSVPAAERAVGLADRFDQVQGRI